MIDPRADLPYVPKLREGFYKLIRDAIGENLPPDVLQGYRPSYLQYIKTRSEKGPAHAYHSVMNMPVSSKDKPLTELMKVIPYKGYKSQADKQFSVLQQNEEQAVSEAERTEKAKQYFKSMRSSIKSRERAMFKNRPDLVDALDIYMGSGGNKQALSELQEIVKKYNLNIDDVVHIGRLAQTRYESAGRGKQVRFKGVEEMAQSEDTGPPPGPPPVQPQSYEEMREMFLKYQAEEKQLEDKQKQLQMEAMQKQQVMEDKDARTAHRIEQEMVEEGKKQGKVITPVLPNPDANAIREDRVPFYNKMLSGFKSAVDTGGDLLKTFGGIVPPILMGDVAGTVVAMGQSAYTLAEKQEKQKSINEQIKYIDSEPIRSASSEAAPEVMQTQNKDAFGVLKEMVNPAFYIANQPTPLATPQPTRTQPIQAPPQPPQSQPQIPQPQPPQPQPPQPQPPNPIQLLNAANRISNDYSKNMILWSLGQQPKKVEKRARTVMPITKDVMRAMKRYKTLEKLYDPDTYVTQGMLSSTWNLPIRPTKTTNINLLATDARSFYRNDISPVAL